MYQWPIIDETLKQSVLEQLERSISDVDSSGILGEVEDIIREYYNVDHSIFFSCATGAMHTLYYALNFHPGDNIIVPTYTFFATFSPFAYEGVEIRQVDCDPFGNINPNEIVRVIDDKTKAVVVTHMWGIPANMEKISAICKSYSLILIEDCSHAHLATYQKQKVGTFGHVGIFSTNQKTLTSGEGGFLITNDQSIFNKSLCVAHYNKRIKKEVHNPELSRISLTGLGLKYRGFTLGAAILRHQFHIIDRLKRQRTVNYQTLFQAVEKSKVFTNINPDYEWESGLYVFPFNAEPDIREHLLQRAYNEGFSYFDAPSSTKPLYEEPLFLGDQNIFHRLSVPKFKQKYPNADKFHQRIVKLPLWGDGNGENPEEIVNQYANFIGRF